MRACAAIDEALRLAVNIQHECVRGAEIGMRKQQGAQTSLILRGVSGTHTGRVPQLEHGRRIGRNIMSDLHISLSQRRW